MDVNEIKAIVASYWRYQRQCPMVAFEANNSLWSCNDGGQADVLVVTPRLELLEVEVKMNLADLRRDRRKVKHRWLVDHSPLCPLHYFYFAVPLEMKEAAAAICRDRYSYAGLITVGAGGDVEVVIAPRKFDRPPLNLKQLRRMALEMSATICRLANRSTPQEED